MRRAGGVLEYARCYFGGGDRRARLLVETAEVEELIGRADSKLRLVNASWYLPTSDINAVKQHTEHRLTQST